VKRGTLVFLALAVPVLAGATAVAVYYIDRTVSTTGEQAVQAMNAEERAALGRVLALRRGMTAEEVFRSLGPPSEDLGLLAKWDGFGGSALSQVRVYFLDGRPVKVRWLKLGAFVYERNL
jgi:pheromone shutdown protein TraB